jgi:hypothetical protein
MNIEFPGDYHICKVVESALFNKPRDKQKAYDKYEFCHTETTARLTFGRLSERHRWRDDTQKGSWVK